MQRDPFCTGEYYHIFNRGTDKRKIFNTQRDYARFTNAMVRLNTDLPSWKNYNLLEVEPRVEDQLVDIVAYCLNPNHFHFILKQRKDGGISEFMRKIGTGYTMYFNKINDRSGALFQGRFKSVHINSSEYFLYVSVYVNCNNEIHGISPAKNYKWSSFNEYCGKNKSSIRCEKKNILGQLRKTGDYEEYARTQTKAMKKKKMDINGVDHLLLE